MLGFLDLKRLMPSESSAHLLEAGVQRGGYRALGRVMEEAVVKPIRAEHLVAILDYPHRASIAIVIEEPADAIHRSKKGKRLRSRGLEHQIRGESHPTY